MEKALEEIKRQLTPENIAVELFSETSATFDEVLDLAVEYAAEMREEVKGSVRWKRKLDEIEEIPWGGIVLARVAKRML